MHNLKYLFLGLATGLSLVVVSHAKAQSLNEDWAMLRKEKHGVAVHISAPIQLSGARYAVASYYGGGEKLNRHTASGEVFRPSALTAAHRTLPFGTRLLVMFRGRSVVVRVSDRGPAAWTGRSLDLSRGAAQALGMLGAGIAKVQIVRL